MLICSCGEEYSIKDNIPILLPKDKYLERLNILNKELENLTTTYDKIHSQELYNVLEEHKFLPTFVNFLKNPKILDIGCGTGPLFNFLPKDSQISGIDISISALTIANTEVLANSHA